MKVDVFLYWSLTSVCLVVVNGLSSLSSFLGQPCTGTWRVGSGAGHNHHHHHHNSNNYWVMFDSTSHDPPRNAAPAEYNPWTVLAMTEAWISRTLDSSSSSSSTNNNNNNMNRATPDAAGGLAVGAGTTSSGSSNTNPYTRKEVSYVCETQKETSLIIAGIFRRLKQAREQGQEHAVRQEQRRREPDYNKDRPMSTFRQTQVVVIPANRELSESFPVFDQLVHAINQARRNARDYVTDDALDKIDERLYDAGDDDQDDDDDDDEEVDASAEWNVAINLAHLHPKFGDKTPEQQLEEMKKEEEVGEVDVNYQEYQRKKQLARRSPYPTVVLEVRATPPIDFGALAAGPIQQTRPGRSIQPGNRDGVTAADIQRLEALFGMSAAMNHPTKQMTPEQSEDAFYDAIGRAIVDNNTNARNSNNNKNPHHPQHHPYDVWTSVTPLNMAQQWIAKNDPNVREQAAFTESRTTQVDAAYEFVFNNLAMMTDNSAISAAAAAAASSSSLDSTGSSDTSPMVILQYLVLPHFLSSAATSFEKFTNEVLNIVSTIPSLKGRVQLTAFHPEHIQSTRRCPIPVLCLSYQP